ANVDKGVASTDLEAVTGLTRYALARHFRACLGTSPYRYLVMRRLDRARMLIRHGAPLADAALSAGFADQSHMTRHFKKVYGLSPGRWAAITVQGVTEDRRPLAACARRGGRLEVRSPPKAENQSASLPEMRRF
ncbi:MAG: helix-turn-helix domain-containing protein, partial [SAR324 cluster bacterium]